MPDLSAPAPMRVPTNRDLRLDAFRGLCLVMIFINHVPGNLFESFTSRNFGFSDAAEGFVMMSGVAAGLAYGNDFRPGAGRWMTGILRVLKRVWTLYQVHLLSVVVALGAVAAVVLKTGNAEPLFVNMMQYIWTDPLGVMVGVPLLTHQFGYLNILPMYLVLLLVSPLLFWAGWRWPRGLMAAALLVWFLSGFFRWSLPNYPAEGGWFFNPLTWQVIFTAGLLTGLAAKQGQRFVPVRRWLQVVTGIFLLIALLTAQVAPFAAVIQHSLWLVSEAGAAWNLTVFDKTFVTAPRLLHIFALTYFLSSLPFVRAASGSRFAAPFVLMGRHSLPVFALGSILCLAIQALKKTTGQNLVLDSLFLSVGLGLQYGLAWARQNWPSTAKA